jgi:hypothetical protein
VKRAKDAKPLAQDLGYEVYGTVEASTDWELVPVGLKTKRGDMYVVEDGYGGLTWMTLPDKYLSITVTSRMRPVQRRMRWDCYHIRELTDKCCPVCVVFHRHITTPW